MPTSRPVVTSNPIHFVALIRGMPLKIRATANYQGDQPAANADLGGRNKASVDSELAVLGLFSPQISGAAEQSLFSKFPADRGDRGVAPPARLPARCADAQRSSGG